jgi:LuxR family maltose regulon positive regulatory protein
MEQAWARTSFVDNLPDTTREGELATPLLSTKLHVPTMRSDLVARPSLVERLNEGLEGKLTLVSAPAGYGKTTLVAHWLHDVPRPFVWLTLDANDNDPARFLAYLLAALQAIDPRIGRAVEPMLATPQPPPPESVLTVLINDIAATEEPFVLVLDDYHLISTLAIHEPLAFLLDHQPTSMHLIIATREDPPLPLSRWRARGQMSEIRQADLQFSLAETSDFLQRVMHLALSSDDVAALQRRTEGWIAGLQLTALSMQGRVEIHRLVESFTGSHRYILDYLIEEVFQQQPADTQNFLLSTSVLDRMSVSLCDDLTERDDSDEMLRALEQANLFLIPLDESRQWYRYHHLFADLLRHRLALVTGEESVAQLHRKASQWYEDNGYPGDAIDHALSAHDWQCAAALISEVAGSLLKRGETTTLLRWFQALPDDVILANAQYCCDYSWPLILTGQLEVADSYLEQAKEVAEDDPVLLRQVVSAQVHIARARGDDSRTIELSRKVLPLLAEQDLVERGVVTLNLGIAHGNRGDLEEAHQTLRQALEVSQRSDNTIVKWVSLFFLGRVEAASGRLRRAATLYEQVLTEGEQGGPSMPLAMAHLDLAGLLHEWNDLEAADIHLQQSIDLARRDGHLEVRISAYRLLGMLRQAQGRDGEALQALEKAHQLAGNARLSPLVRARNAACHTQIALAQGDLATAARWADRMQDDADASSFFPHLNLTKARLLMAWDGKAAAMKWLEFCRETAAEKGINWGMIRVRVLQALAAPTAQDSLGFLGEALALGEPEGFVRTFIDEGAPLRALLQQAAEQGISRLYTKKLLSAFEADAFRKTGTPIPSPAQPLIEPLSQRELEVLRLTAEGLSNQEIADRLVITVGTVKTHIHNILGKLDVRGRTQAAARARELGLI